MALAWQVNGIAGAVWKAVRRRPRLGMGKESRCMAPSDNNVLRSTEGSGITIGESAFIM